MDKKINVLELLKDCPKGMILDCTLCDNVTFAGIDNNNIVVERSSNGNKIYLSKWGTFFGHNDAKCVIFPKGKTTWEGFHRPFKEGDIIVAAVTNSIHILKHQSDVYKWSSYCRLGEEGEGNLRLQETTNISPHRFASEEEKQKLFDAIKARGYKWNAETKALEKLVDANSSCTDTLEDCPFGASQLLLAQDVIKWLAENRCASINTVNLFESAADICFNIACKKVTEKRDHSKIKRKIE